MKIISVVGARPNFMKIAPLIKEFAKHKNIMNILVHTGQHYDKNMSKLFFKDLNLPQPDIYLGVGSGSHAEQTASIMIKFEKIITKEKPDLVIVVGDVNSTIACALTASKMGIKIAHVEAGLRSFDRSMPEEINRVLTDSISDLLFVTEKSGLVNLKNEGIDRKRIHFVGNVMIDTLMQHKNAAKKSAILDKLNITKRQYALVTLHRPSNVDTPRILNEILEVLKIISKDVNVVFPVHPRTEKMIKKMGVNASQANKINDKKIVFTEPFGYVDFLKLMSNAKFVLTDSGGIQEETTVLGIPCLTIRENTERPVTISEGTNKLVGTSKKVVLEEASKIIKGIKGMHKIPKFWDGKAAKRIVKIIITET